MRIGPVEPVVGKPIREIYFELLQRALGFPGMFGPCNTVHRNMFERGMWGWVGGRQFGGVIAHSRSKHLISLRKPFPCRQEELQTPKRYGVCLDIPAPPKRRWP